MSSNDRHLRVGHAERDAVAEQLRVAAGEGMLDLEELEERLELAHGARTRADLSSLTADLPIGVPPADPHAQPGAGVPARVPRSTTEPDARWRDGGLVLRTVMGSLARRGPWVVPERIWARSVMGDVTLDLREAHLGRRTDIEASAVLGDITVIVNARTRVHVDGRGVVGDFKEARATVPSQVRDSSPVVVVSGRALLGSVTVKRRGMPGELRRLFLGH